MHNISLNRTFYGIETGMQAIIITRLIRLNRTFYGIETEYKLKESYKDLVLIVPFMELKLGIGAAV